MRLTTTIAALMLVLMPTMASAWEAKVYEGKGGDAVDQDLMPHTAAADRPFYSEDYTFTFRLAGTVKLHLKMGMSNVLGGKGSAFADGYITAGKKRSDIQAAYAAGSWSSKDNRFSIKTPDITLKGNRKELELRYATEDAKVEATLTAVVPGFRPGNGRIELADLGYVSMVVWPKMKVTGKVTLGEKTYRLAGYCIFTHAATTIEPQHMPETWFYFKGEDANNPVLFQGFKLTEEFGGTVHGWAVAVNEQSYVLRTSKLSLKPAAVKETRGASIPWSLLLESPESGTALGAIKGSKLTGVRDRLKKLPKFQAALIRKFIDPRRYLFKAEMELDVGSGKRVRTSGQYKVETMH